MIYGANVRLFSWIGKFLQNILPYQVFMTLKKTFLYNP